MFHRDKVKREERMLLSVFKPIKNNKGMSLMSVMMAAGIGTIVSMGMLSLFTSQLQASRTVAQNYEATYFQNEVRNLISDTEACKRNFERQRADRLSQAGVLRSLKDTNGRDVFQVGNTIAQGQLRIVAIQFGHQASGAEPAIPASGRGITYVSLSLDRMNGSIGSTRIVRRIPLTVTTDASRRVASCSSDPASGGESDLKFDAGNFTEVKSGWTRGPTGWATCPKGAMAVNCSSEINSGDSSSDHYEQRNERSAGGNACRSMTRDGKDTHRAVAWCFSPAKISRKTASNGGGSGGSSRGGRGGHGGYGGGGQEECYQGCQ